MFNYSSNSNIFNREIQEIKQRVSLVVVAENLGLFLRKRGSQYFTLCPFHTERTPSCCLNHRLFHCFGCNLSGDVISFVERILRCTFVEAILFLNRQAGFGDAPYLFRNKSKEPKEYIELAERIYTSALVIEKNSPCLKYFGSRGISERTILTARSIRFMPALFHSETKREHPGIVLLSENFADMDSFYISGIQRIYLSDDCFNKLDGFTSKKMLGSSAAIYFDLPAEIMHIAEEPETALSVRQETEMPTVSTVSASGMMKLPLLAVYRELHVWHDPDPPGQQAFVKLAKRATEQGIHVYAHDPAEFQ